ncbi:MAG: hypothetical protein J0L69_07670 [Bacteroidetes bacterium]|nr:hypothetical protein [Bacteroidota bacterium]
MKRYIAYFDYLGYKDFIFNNDSTHLKRRVEHILRDIERALGQGQFQEPQNGIILADLSRSTINCLNVSDTVIFWTQDDSVQSLEELLSVANQFNWEQMRFNMPARGVIYFDDFEMISGQQRNPGGALYSANIIYGKGLALAHMKGETQSWAGCVIDQTVIEHIQTKVTVATFLAPHAKLYRVPYKKPAAGQQDEYVLTIVKGTLNEQAFKSYHDNIVATFKADNKSIEDPRVKTILDNTIKFLESFKA